MNTGTLYCIGVGPGDSELLTVKSVRIIGRCRDIFVPASRPGTTGVALTIAKPYVTDEHVIHEILFPMEVDKVLLKQHWDHAASKIAEHLRQGKDGCFLTLGDPLLYSTSIYLVRSLKALLPDAAIEMIPGIPAMCAVASLTQFPLGEAKQPVVIIPTSDNLDTIREAVRFRGTVVLMKVGARLQPILRLLDELDVLDRCVFVAHAGMDNQHIETDCRKLLDTHEETGYLSTILINAAEVMP